MRLFTAVELPGAVREHLLGVKSQLSAHFDPSAVAWVKAENLHVTLKFLGEVPDAAVVELTEFLGRVPVEPMRLVPDHMVVFPKRGPVRVIAVGLSGDVQQLGELFHRIEDACAEVGFQREGRAYTPHVTLGRARPGRGGAELRRARESTLALGFPGPTFTAEGFVLMRSQLNPKGAIYTPAARFPLRSRT